MTTNQIAYYFSANLRYAKPLGYFQEPPPGFIVIGCDPHIHPGLPPGPAHLIIAGQFLSLPLDVDGLIAALFGRLQVFQMGRDHGAFAGPQAELFGGAPIDGGRGLEGLEVLGRQDPAPGEAGMFGHVLEQVDVLVRQRARPEPSVEGFQPGRGVGPGVGIMPDAGEGHDLVVRPQADQAVFLQALHQGRARMFVHGDETGGRVVGGAEFFVVGPPELREMGPGNDPHAEPDRGGDGGRGGVERVRGRGAEGFEHGRMQIHYRAEDLPGIFPSQ